MKIRFVGQLPFVSVTLMQGGKTAVFENVLLDTGSGSSVFSAHMLQQAGILPRPDAIVRQMVGVGGSESVVEVNVDAIHSGTLSMNNFVIESGSVNYGFGFDGILGFDFLQQTGAIIDLHKMEIRKTTAV